LASAIGNQPKPGSFAAKMKAKQEAAAAENGSSGGAGLFKKY